MSVSLSYRPTRVESSLLIAIVQCGIDFSGLWGRLYVYGTLLLCSFSIGDVGFTAA